MSVSVMSKEKAERIIRFSIQYSSIALLYYDYALTFSREVKCFWSRKFSISTVLYWACRYAMAANVLYTLAIANRLPKIRVCDGGYQICAVLSVFGRAAILIVWGARTYAVFDRHKGILFLFGCLGVFIMVLASIHIPYIACNGNKGKPPSNPLSKPCASYTEGLIKISVVPGLLNIFTVVFEVLSALLTTIRGYQTLSMGGSWASQKEGLTYLVLKHGLLYFAFVSAFSVAAVILQSEAPAGSFIQRLLNALTLPISGLMTARFLLHLREWEQKGLYTGPNDRLFRSTFEEAPIEFRVLGRPGFHSEWSVADDLGSTPVVTRIHFAGEGDERVSASTSSTLHKETRGPS